MTPQDDVAVVREALHAGYKARQKIYWDNAHAALDRLDARVRELEAERDNLRRVHIEDTGRWIDATRQNARLREALTDIRKNKHLGNCDGHPGCACPVLIADAALADPVEWPDGDEVGQPTC